MQPVHTHTHTHNTQMDVMLWLTFFYGPHLSISSAKVKVHMMTKEASCMPVSWHQKHSQWQNQERENVALSSLCGKSYLQGSAWGIYVLYRVSSILLICSYNPYLIQHNTLHTPHTHHLSNTPHTCQTPTNFTHFIYFIHHSPMHPIHCISQTHGIIMTTTDLLVTIYDKSWLAMGQ